MYGKTLLLADSGGLVLQMKMGSNMISIHSFYLSHIAWIEKF